MMMTPAVSWLGPPYGNRKVPYSAQITPLAKLVAR